MHVRTEKKMKMNIKRRIRGNKPFADALILVLTLLLAPPVLSQDSDFFPVPESYEVEGIPPIKKSEVEHLFFEPGTVRSNLIWDADRKNRRLLITDQTNNIYLLSSPLAQPEKLVEKVVPNLVRMRPDGQAFAYTSDLEDEDNFQLFLYDFEKKPPPNWSLSRAKTNPLTIFFGVEQVTSYCTFEPITILRKAPCAAMTSRRKRAFRLK